MKADKNWISISSIFCLAYNQELPQKRSLNPKIYVWMYLEMYKCVKMYLKFTINALQYMLLLLLIPNISVYKCMFECTFKWINVWEYIQLYVKHTINATVAIGSQTIPFLIAFYVSARGFLGVKFGWEILLPVKELILCNSAKQYPPSLPFMFLRAAPALHCNALVHPHNTISSFGRENIEHNHLIGA